MSKKVHIKGGEYNSTLCGIAIEPHIVTDNPAAPEFATPDCKNCLRVLATVPPPPVPSGDIYAEAAKEIMNPSAALASRSPARKMAALGMAYGTGASAFRLAMIDPLYNHLTNKKSPENRMKSWRRRL